MKEQLKKYASNQFVELTETDLEKLEKEIKFVEIEMQKISNLENIEPITYPFVTYEAEFREDFVKNELPIEDVIKNAKETKDNQFKVPKVVD